MAGPAGVSDPHTTLLHRVKEKVFYQSDEIRERVAPLFSIMVTTSIGQDLLQKFVTEDARINIKRSRNDEGWAAQPKLFNILVPMSERGNRVVVIVEGESGPVAEREQMHKARAPLIETASLLHELVHIVFQNEGSFDHTPDPEFENTGERFTIEKENLFREQVGLSKRTNHLGYDVLYDTGGFIPIALVLTLKHFISSRAYGDFRSNMDEFLAYCNRSPTWIERLYSDFLAPQNRMFFDIFLEHCNPRHFASVLAFFSHIPVSSGETEQEIRGILKDWLLEHVEDSFDHIESHIKSLRIRDVSILMNSLITDKQSPVYRRLQSIINCPGISDPRGTELANQWEDALLFFPRAWFEEVRTRLHGEPHDEEDTILKGIIRKKAEESTTLQPFFINPLVKALKIAALKKRDDVLRFIYLSLPQAWRRDNQETLLHSMQHVHSVDVFNQVINDLKNDNNVLLFINENLKHAFETHQNTFIVDIIDNEKALSLVCEKCEWSVIKTLLSVKTNTTQSIKLANQIIPLAWKYGEWGLLITLSFKRLCSHLESFLSQLFSFAHSHDTVLSN